MTEITTWCTGCGACYQGCPASAIKMVTNKEGFLYPEINEDLCLDCGKCVKTCPSNLKLDELIPKKIYAVKYRGKEIYYSASGGAFYGIARHVIESGGVVFGAAYSNDWFVKHIKVTDCKSLRSLQSSKYVQSDTGVTFQECKAELEKGRLVLYSGTPCQISGLIAYLGKDYPNLYTIDLICHGVPSPLLFQDYVVWLGRKKHGEILEYNFRSKERGWGLDYWTKTKTKSKIKSKTSSCSRDPYYRSFLIGETYRECCYKCKYASVERVSDFTVGDFWGIEKAHSEFNDRRGVSVIFLNTEKAEKKFSEVCALFDICPSSLNEIVVAQVNLRAPTNRPAIRDTIYDEIDSLEPSKYVQKKLCSRITFVEYIKLSIPMPVKKVIKRILGRGDN